MDQLHIYTIAPTESAFVWKVLLVDMKAPGTDEILIFISDCLKSNTARIFKVFLDVQYQSFNVHLSRTVADEVRVTEREEMCGDLKFVYHSENREMCKKVEICLS